MKAVDVDDAVAPQITDRNTRDVCPHIRITEVLSFEINIEGKVLRFMQILNHTGK